MPRKEKKSKGVQTSRHVEPKLPGGFRDYGPAEAIARDRVVITVKRVFEQFGFMPIDTSSVQRTSVLTGGDTESDKIIFNVKGSREKKGDSSLRFDLTVPLARFLAAHPEIPKPFKRYEIGNVWRGESPQAGRYREFLQADVDIVGSASIDADSEIVTLMHRIFTTLRIPRFVIAINSRKILGHLPGFAGFGENKLTDALRVIDKKDKIGDEGTEKELIALFDKKTAHKIRDFLTLVGNELPDTFEGAADIKTILHRAHEADIEPSTIRFDPYIVRGLSYYTGAVFEAVLPDLPQIGSVCAGGRYDNLVATFTGAPLPAVGASLGVDRLFAAMESLNMLGKTPSIAQVLIFNLTPDLYAEYMFFADSLRERNINTMLYVGDDKTFQAQLAYAVRWEAPFALIYGEQENKKGVVAVKNLVERTQEEVPKERVIEYMTRLLSP